MYDHGEGVPVNKPEAIRWYRQAASRGDGWIQIRLGSIYDRGDGVPVNPAEALRWYTLAANQGFAWPQLRLAQMYAEGRGTRADLVTAHMWADIAAAQKTPGSDAYRASLQSHMSRAQVDVARKRAAAWRAQRKT
jgi:TPR repeat protein